MLSAALAQGEQPDSGTVKVVFGGDVMLDGGPGHALCHGEDVFAGVAAILKDADIAVCNLECVVAKCGRPVEKPYTFKARPACIPTLQRYFSAVSIANNHSGDYGPDALLEQLASLETGKLPYFGGGRNRKDAHRPAVLERKGRRLALLGYNDFPPRSFEAGERRPGTAWLEPNDVIADIKAAKAAERADLVIPMLHWGEELEPAPQESQKALARRLIDAGADAVIGGHPHVTQTIDFYKGRPMVYSLGNFVFDYFPGDPLMWTGWIVRLTFSKAAAPDLEVFVVELDRAGIPHLLPKPEKK